jgi:hypothetical protein
MFLDEVTQPNAALVTRLLMLTSPYHPEDCEKLLPPTE